MRHACDEQIINKRQCVRVLYVCMPNGPMGIPCDGKLGRQKKNIAHVKWLHLPHKNNHFCVYMHKK